jgi:AcrR family transcriptional regulator
MPRRLPTDSTQVKAHRTKPEHGEHTRAQLLALAREMFAQRGYDRVALQDLCERAGVTRGALYHHFPGKDALFRAVCEDLAADLQRQIVAGARQERTARARLDAGCAAFLDACADLAVRQILLTDAPSVLGWQAYRDLDARHGLGLVKSALRAALTEQHAPTAQVDTLAHLIVAALNEAAMLIANAPDEKTARSDSIKSISRLLSGAFQAPPS